MKPYRFSQPNGHFQIVVFAPSLKAARAHIRRQNHKPAYAALTYEGKGHPTNPEVWAAANAGQ